jgi:hypothetical protein
MNARFRPSSGGRVEGAAGLYDATTQPGPAAGPSGGACCCVAQAVVRVVMPPTSGRPDVIELLLCGHHYRLSRDALVATHATVSELPGSAADVAAWFDDDPGHAAPTPVPTA